MRLVGRKEGRPSRRIQTRRPWCLDALLIRKVFAVARRVDDKNTINKTEYLKCEEDLEKESSFHQSSTLKLRYVRNEVEVANKQFRNLDLLHFF